MRQKVDTVIAVSDLIKDFGHFRALNKLKLHVNNGEVHGFLGPNGSGKSTTIRILLGLLHKTEGDVTLFGEDPRKNAEALHRRLAYVPGEVNFWPNLTGGEVIDLLSYLRGGLDKKRRDDLLRRFELDPSRKFRTYSKGNRQKVALVAALASDVDLYVLDEPTSGLDPVMEQVFQDYIREMKQQGKTILLSSHILAEVEALCDQVTIIREGATVASGTLQQLRRLHRSTIQVTTEHPLTGLKDLPGVHNVRNGGNHAEFEVDDSGMDAVLKYLAKSNVQTLVCQPPSLENLFLRHYDDELRADESLEEK